LIDGCEKRMHALLQRGNLLMRKCEHGIVRCSGTALGFRRPATLGDLALSIRIHTYRIRINRMHLFELAHTNMSRFRSCKPNGCIQSRIDPSSRLGISCCHNACTVSYVLLRSSCPSSRWRLLDSMLIIGNTVDFDDLTRPYEGVSICPRSLAIRIRSVG
jgi:hypothetical protein